MKKIVLFIAILTSSLFAKFGEVDVPTFQKMQADGVVVIDIRRVSEWQEVGIIEGSKTIQFFDIRGGFDFVVFMRELTKYIKDSNQPFIIYCAHANRTRTLGNFLGNQLGMNVYHLQGGINHGWIKAGKPVVKYKGDR
jgi:rhodanese-related sulfurtransferase